MKKIKQITFKDKEITGLIKGCIVEFTYPVSVFGFMQQLKLKATFNGKYFEVNSYTPIIPSVVYPQHINFFKNKFKIIGGNNENNKT
jgi:hypothetical protein